MNSLTILDESGDTQIRWDPEDAAETAQAREAVEALRLQGYTFFLVDGTPADEVAAGRGVLNCRRLTSEEVSALVEDASPTQPTSAESAGSDQAKGAEGGDAPAKRRGGRQPKEGANVVAHRPMRGG